MTYNYNFCKNAYPYTFVSSCAIVAPRAIVATHINVYPYSIVAPQAIEMSIIIIKVLLAFLHCRLPDPHNNKCFFFFIFSDRFTCFFSSPPHYRYQAGEQCRFVALSLLVASVL